MDTYGANGTFIKDNENFYQKDIDISCKYVFKNFEKAILTCTNIENEIKKICIKNNVPWNDLAFKFDIKLHRQASPVHLFTKKEIEEVLRNGNDHINNTLVIDINGYAKLIPRKEYDYLLLKQFPIIHESYCAYNNYTGKYSKLNQLEDEYLASLIEWESHLKYGGNRHASDIYGNKNETELINSIKKLYENYNFQKI